jgi:hypothetical protein
VDAVVRPFSGWPLFAVTTDEEPVVSALSGHVEDGPSVAWN